MQLEIIDNLKRMRELEEAWSHLARTTPYPMLQYNWMLSAAEAYEDQMDLQIFAIWEGSALAAVAPLGYFRHGLQGQLRCLADNVGEPDAFLYSNQAALDGLLSAILRQGRALKPSHLSRDGAEYASLKASGRRGEDRIRRGL